MRTRTKVLRRLAPLALLCAGQALAAGGHHVVDDAAMLQAGQCEIESWVSRATGGERLLHAGANCGVGPVELGLATEHVRLQGASATDWGVEAKWATQVAQGWSIGAKAGPSWSAHVRPRYQGAAVAGLASWQASDAITLHFNLGRDFARAARDQGRYGAAIEWAPAPRWWLLAERYKEQDSHFARLGARTQAGERWSIDVSRTQRLTGPGVSQWTLGACWSFDLK